ncbi:PREDICTED: uncharacterized protein LOC109581410 [Amphimedon queenslandica]|nr:PREDICTED: uncharacterized protein LOC109581410 [Amphimedon queenslandica]|eukprot:XP_019851044.1 PREDICTED: uncharacterized protein LOC109581410 [Amphimedon queenslandica]
MNLMTILLNTADKPLCPGCYPDTVHMFINFSSGHIKQYEFSVPPGETTFHEKNISVMKNAVLSGDIYYCNVAECVKTKLDKLSTFDLQLVHLKSADNGSVCLECTFTNGSLADGCIVELHVSTDVILKLKTSAKRDNLITTECYAVNTLTSNESYHWEAYAFSLSNGEPFKLSSKPALTGVLTIPIKTSPTTESPTLATSGSPNTESPTSGPSHDYKLIVSIGITIFLLVCAVLAVSVSVYLIVTKKFQLQSCGRSQVQLVPEMAESGLLSSGEPPCQPASYQLRGHLDTILEDCFINEAEVELLPVIEQEAVIENNNVTVSSFVVQHTTHKPRKRPASISLPLSPINNEITLSPHPASQPTTPNVPAPDQFSFGPPGPTRNSSFPQLPFPPS